MKRSVRVSEAEVQKLVTGAGYTLLEIIEADGVNRKMITVKCGKNHEPYKVPYSRFKSGNRCPECNLERQRLTLDYVVSTMTKEGFQYISGEYKNNKSLIQLRCPNNHVFTSSHDKFRSGRRCGKCHVSKGENFTYVLLMNMLPGIPVEPQHGVKINGTVYKYDFCVHTAQRLLVEYDGEFHFRAIENLGGEEEFKKQQYNDRLKNNYAAKEDTPLLRIPYTYSYPEIYNALASFFKTHNIPFSVIEDIRTLYQDIYKVDTKRRKEVAEFYLTHSLKESEQKFNIDQATILYHFKAVYGSTKRDHLQKHTKEEIANYYLTHSIKETSEFCGLTYKAIRCYFADVYGSDKRNYIRNLEKDKPEEASRISKFKKFVGISPDGERYESTNQVQFAKDHGLSRSGMSMCLIGSREHTKGWKFKYID